MNYASFATKVTYREMADFAERHREEDAVFSWVRQRMNMTGDDRVLMRAMNIFAVVAVAVTLLDAVVNKEIPYTFGFLAVCIIGLSIALRADLRQLHHTGVIYERFARDNNLQYVYRDADAPMHGVIFGFGNSKERRHVVMGDGRVFGNYRYGLQEREDSGALYEWAYFGMDLGCVAPHILLDSKKNNQVIFGKRVSDLPSEAHFGMEVLALEGDFGNYFTVYIEPTHQQDVLYILTPDVMARLVDYGAEYDIEVVDGKIYAYSKKVFGRDVKNIEAVNDLADNALTMMRENIVQQSRHQPISDT